MANALVPIDDDGFASQHCQHVALRTNRGAASTADAIRSIDVRVLGSRAVGVQLPFFSGFTSTGLLLAKTLQVTPHEDQGDDGRDDQRDDGVHIELLKEPHKQHEPDVEQREKRERVAEGFVYNVPEVEYLLRT